MEIVLQRLRACPPRARGKALGSDSPKHSAPSVPPSRANSSVRRSDKKRRVTGRDEASVVRSFEHPQGQCSEGVSGSGRVLNIHSKRGDLNDRVVFWCLRPAGRGRRRIGPWIWLPHATEETLEMWHRGVEVGTAPASCCSRPLSSISAQQLQPQATDARRFSSATTKKNPSNSCCSSNGRESRGQPVDPSQIANAISGLLSQSGDGHGRVRGPRHSFRVAPAPAPMQRL